jgi:hypothetical protein
MSLETRIDWQPERTVNDVSRLGREAEARGAAQFVERGNQRVPFATGELAASAFVEASDDGALVGWGARHARPVRARGRALRGRSARWVDEAMDEAEQQVGRTIEDTLRSGWPAG